MHIESGVLVLKNKDGQDVHLHMKDVYLHGKYFNERDLRPVSNRKDRFTFYIDIPLSVAKELKLAYHYKDKKNDSCLILCVPIESESEVKYCWEFIRNYWILASKGMECFVSFLNSENMRGYNSTEAGDMLAATMDKISAK